MLGNLLQNLYSESWEGALKQLLRDICLLAQWIQEKHEIDTNMQTQSNKFVLCRCHNEKDFHERKKVKHPFSDRATTDINKSQNPERTSICKPVAFGIFSFPQGRSQTHEQPDLILLDDLRQEQGVLRNKVKQNEEICKMQVS